VAKTRQRGTGVRIRSEAKAAAADRLLLAAKGADSEARRARGELTLISRWRRRRWRRKQAEYVLWLERFHAAITSAQDIAKKGRYVEL
jgi:hypothetical protein